MALTITILGSKQVEQKLTGLANNIRNFTGVWDDILDAIYEIEESQFETEGHGKWAPLSPKYAKWKEANYPGRGLLILTEDLIESVTGGRGGVVRKTRDTLEFSTNVPYWRFHQEGTRKMPQRKVLDLQAGDEQKIADVFEAWVRRQIT